MIKKRNPLISVSLTGIAVACSLAGDMAIYTVLPVIYLDVGLSAIQVGILLAANRYIRLLTNPLSDFLLRRFTARALLFASLVVGGGIALVYSAMPPFWLFLLLRLTWGLCWSVLRQVGIMNASGKSSERFAARMTGIYNGISRIGFFTGTLLSGVLLDATSYEMMFIIMACIIFAGILPATFAFRHNEMVPVKRGNTTNAVTALRSTQYIQAIKGVVVGAVGSGMVMSTLGHVLRVAAGSNVTIGSMVIGIASLNGILLSVRAFVGIIGGPTTGILVDKTGLRNGEIIAFAGGAFALVTALVAPGVLVMVVAIVAFSVFETTAMVALTAETSKTSRGYAIYASASDLGSATGPLLAWMLIEAGGSRRIGFLIGACLYVGAMLLVLFSKKRNET